MKEVSLNNRAADGARGGVGRPPFFRPLFPSAFSLPARAIGDGWVKKALLFRMPFRGMRRPIYLIFGGSALAPTPNLRNT